MFGIGKVEYDGMYKLNAMQLNPTPYRSKQCGSSPVVIHVYREIVTRTIYVRAPLCQSEKRIPRRRNARAQLSLDAEINRSGYLPLPRIKPRAWRGSVPRTVIRYSMLKIVISKPTDVKRTTRGSAYLASEASRRFSF